MTVTCDKTRIRPLVRALWDRKIAHLATLPPFIRWMFHWRWASHTDMMMSDWSEDVEDSTDQTVHTLEDMVKKYIIDEPHRQTYHALMGMFKPMFLGHPSLAEPDDTPVTGGGGSVLKPQVEVSRSQAARPHDAKRKQNSHTTQALHSHLPFPPSPLYQEWFTKWFAHADDLQSYQLAWSVCYAVAEGNLRMLQHLHEKHNADLTLGTAANTHTDRDATPITTTTTRLLSHPPHCIYPSYSTQATPGESRSSTLPLVKAIHASSST